MEIHSIVQQTSSCVNQHKAQGVAHVISEDDRAAAACGLRPNIKCDWLLLIYIQQVCVSQFGHHGRVMTNIRLL